MNVEHVKINNARTHTELSTHDFYYDLPEELIAQFPSEERDMCRLMTIDRQSGKISHKVFRDIIDHLRPEDMLVVNSSKVIPARLLGTTLKTGSSIELLLLRTREDGSWETLVRPGKRARVGASFDFSGILRATVTEVLDDGNRIVLRLRIDDDNFIRLPFLRRKRIEKPLNISARIERWNDDGNAHQRVSVLNRLLYE